MQKRKYTVILSVGAISLISILITVILTHTMPYSQNRLAITTSMLDLLELLQVVIIV